MRAMPRAATGLLWLVGVVPAQGAPPVIRQGGWHQLTTENFQVVGSASDSDLRRVASRLEQFRLALGAFSPAVLATTPVPTTVIVFRGTKDHEPFKPVWNGKPQSDVTGQFMAGRASNLVALSAGASAGLEVVYHEYVHAVVRHLVRDLPVWYDEGFAELYSTFDISEDGRRAEIGLFKGAHLARLNQAWMPLSTLVALDRRSPEYNERNKRGLMYAESWAFVHYLLLGHQGRYASQVPAFLTQLAKDANLEQASSIAFHTSAAALESELRAYVRQITFPSRVVGFTGRNEARTAAPITPFSEAEAHAMLGDLLVRLGRLDEARAYGESAIAAQPDLPRAHKTMARLLLAASRREEAFAYVSRLAPTGEAPWNEHYEYADLLIAVRGAGPTSVDTEIERQLQRTIELQPAFPEAHAQLGWVRTLRRATTRDAIPLLERALALSPGNERYWLMLAEVYAQLNDHASVRAVAVHLVRAAEDSGTRGRATELLAAADKALGGRGQGLVRSPSGGTDDLTLRKPLEGERRVSGRLAAVECTESGRVVFVVESRESMSRLEASAIERVQVISYRADVRGTVSCGSQPRSPVVVVTYLPGGGGQPPAATAVEFMPEGYEPK